MCMHSAGEDGKVTNWHKVHYGARAQGHPHTTSRPMPPSVLDADPFQIRIRLCRSDLDAAHRLVERSRQHLDLTRHADHFASGEPEDGASQHFQFKSDETWLRIRNGRIRHIVAMPVFETCVRAVPGYKINPA